jgi:flagellar operon protein
MSDRITIGQLYPGRISPATPTGGAKVQQPARNPSPSRPFQEVLRDTHVQFSHHAEMRLQQRGISLQTEQLAKLGTAIDQAAAKGAKDSLILYNDIAFIVNVKNRTVVTAVDGTSMQDNVFTKIDSAVIVS